MVEVVLGDLFQAGAVGVFLDLRPCGVGVQHLADMRLVHHVLSLARGKLLAGVDEQDIAPRLVRAALFAGAVRSEEHTSELQSLMRISYAVFCLTKKNK